MHVGQQQRHAYHAERKGRQQRPVIHALSPAEPPEQQPAEDEGRTQPQPRQRRLVPAAAVEGIDRGGVIVEAGADAVRLGEVEQHGLQKVSPRYDRRRHRRHIGCRDDPELPPGDALMHQQHQKHRAEENRLKLEGKGQRDHRQRQPASAGKGRPQRHHRQRYIDHIALTPESAVEKHRRQPQRPQKSRKSDVLPSVKVPHQLHAAPGEHHVKGHGKHFDKVEIREIEIGTERQKEQIRYIIVAHRGADGTDAAAAAEKIHPHGKEVLIVQRLIIQHRKAQRKGACQQHRRRDPARPRIRDPLPQQQKHGD